MEEIVQLKIILKWTKPPIWRRILVKKEITFYDLHQIIQIVMGWENDHLFEFKLNNTRIGEPDEEFEDIDFGSNKVLDAFTLTLSSQNLNTKDKFEYEYDFGDSWKHQILVEKILPKEEKRVYPMCIGGKLNCPPEDCGGIGGFYNLIEILNNKNHPDRDDMIHWLGEKYNPEYFDIDYVNTELSSKFK